MVASRIGLIFMAKNIETDKKREINLRRCKGLRKLFAPAYKFIYLASKLITVTNSFTFILSTAHRKVILLYI